MKCLEETVRAPRTIHLTAYLLGVGGAALLTALIIRQGATDVATAVAGAAWGLVAVSALHGAKLLADTIGWLMVIPKGDRLRLRMPANFTTPLILESVVQGVRGAMFLVPGALGVQESGYLIVGNLLGIPGETALALSLIRRVRELIVGIPGLVVWQLLEGGRLWRSRFLRATQDPQQIEKMKTRSRPSRTTFLLRKH
jgi:hypothetical protein